MQDFLFSLLVGASVVILVSGRRDLRDLATLEPSQLARFKSQHATVGPTKTAFKGACVLSEDLVDPAPLNSASRCPEFQSSACCSQREHDALDKDFQAAYDSLDNECTGCAENRRILMCSIHCSPHQNELMSIQKPVKGNLLFSHESASIGPNLHKKIVVVPIAQASCKEWHKACADTTAGGLFKSDAASFCLAQMDSSRNIFLQIEGQIVPKPQALQLFGPDTCTIPANFETRRAAAKMSSNQPPVFVAPLHFFQSRTFVIFMWVLAIVVVFAGLMTCVLTLGGVLPRTEYSKPTAHRAALRASRLQPIVESTLVKGDGEEHSDIGHVMAM